MRCYKTAISYSLCFECVPTYSSVVSQVSNKSENKTTGSISVADHSDSIKQKADTESWTNTCLDTVHTLRTSELLLLLRHLHLSSETIS